MNPVIDHIQITVKNLETAERFYDKFLSVIGFDLNRKIKTHIREHDFHVIEYTHDRLAFAINSPREAFRNEIVNRRKPGALHHLAFKAESREEVDKAFIELKKIGAVIVSEPQIHYEYGENYYAVYFKDQENIKYEIVCTREENT